MEYLQGLQTMIAVAVDKILHYCHTKQNVIYQATDFNI